MKQQPKAGFEKQALLDAIAPIFRIVNGKLFCPKRDEQCTYLILALKKGGNDNKQVLKAVETDFKIAFEDFKIGESLPQ